MKEKVSFVSVQELFEEPSLPKIEDKDLLVFSLLNSKKEMGLTEAHKNLFLAFSEEHIQIPFEFFKHNYGPFSKELELELTSLKKQGFIEIITTRVINCPKKTIKLTDKGQKKIRSESNEINNITAKLKNIINNYKEYNAISLEKYCYDKYLLRKKGKSVEEWLTERKGKISELIILNDVLFRLFADKQIDENKKILICTSLDYTNKLLNCPSLNTIDEVISGVIIKNIEAYLQNWNKMSIILGQSTNDSENLKKIMKENKEIFFFINLLSEKYGLMDSLFSEIPCVV